MWPFKKKRLSEREFARQTERRRMREVLFEHLWRITHQPKETDVGTIPAQPVPDGWGDETKRTWLRELLLGD